MSREPQQAARIAAGPDVGWVSLAVPGGDVRYCADFLPAGRADALFASLRDGIAWRCDTVRVFGREHPIPRRHCWYGDPGVGYHWSGLSQRPQKWPPALAELRDELERGLGARFNGALANLYRDGRDHMGWHADDERELGAEPVIASLSFGATRDFVLRPRERNAGHPRVSVPLMHGSLLVMRGATQRYWQHAVPKRQRVSEPRINLTFRYVLKAA